MNDKSEEFKAKLNDLKKKLEDEIAAHNKVY